jgi:hypothetical protein
MVPHRLPHIRQFTVGDELVLVSADETPAGREREAPRRALTLNASGRGIWDLCDGRRSIDGIVDALAAQFSVDKGLLQTQVRQALVQLARQGVIGGIERATPSGPDTTFVIGIEDKPYFWWQTAIWLESLRDKLPAGWRTYVVVCNDGKEISPELRNILTSYDTEFARATNHASSRRIDIGWKGGDCHAALNRVEALSAAAATVRDEDLICLLDSDIFLFGDLNLDIMPKGCAAARNWHIETRPFFSTVDKNGGKGVDLYKLLEAIGCEQPFLPGGVNVFVAGKVARDAKFIADCYRFAHALFLLARAAGVEVAWMAEMPCFTLAMSANGIAYELLERKELIVSDCDEETIPYGTFYHYYSDPKDFGRTAFRNSKWHKQAYVSEDFLKTDFAPFAHKSATDHERYFFQLAKKARQRLDV